MSIGLPEWAFKGWLRRLPEESKTIVLTFDDGPGQRTTPQLLNVLADAGVRATMFLSGDRCRQYPALVREIFDAGHQVANHGFLHRSLLLAQPSAVRESIQRTREAIVAAGAAPSIWFRPPYGSFNPWTLGAVRTAGLNGALWSVMIPDWRPLGFDSLSMQLAKQLHPGAVVVLHDDPQQSAATLVALVNFLVDFSRNAGWQIAPLPSHPISQSARN
ncbi:polysaccharide deacetylase family protein [candidate division KSB1 bacterium]|nr:polysaccharide deacetylase family protein [candidate division KSB1 bacterium]